MSARFIKFYGADWRGDVALRMCSAAARGVWADCLSLMMEAEPYGHLVIAGRPATAEQIAALTSTPAKVVRAALAELEANGVPSRTEDGVIYSRRMVRDARRSAEGRENGKSGGNPSLKRHGVNPVPGAGGLTPPVKGEDKAGDKAHAGKPEARSQKPEAKQLGEDAAGADAAGLIGLGNALLDALGHDPARFTGSFQAVRGWLDAGWTAEALLAEAHRIAGREGFQPPRSPFGYLAKALPASPPAVAEAGGEDGERLRWRMRLEGFRDRGFWLDGWGARPGEAGCGAPADLLAAFGWGRRDAA